MGGVDVGERRAGAVAGELERVAQPRAVAGEIHDQVAVAFSHVEHEGVVAGVAGEHIGARAAVDRVVAGIAVEAVRECIAGAEEIAGALQHQRLDVCSQRIADRANTASVPAPVFSNTASPASSTKYTSLPAPPNIMSAPPAPSIRLLPLLP